MNARFLERAKKKARSGEGPLETWSDFRERGVGDVAEDLTGEQRVRGYDGLWYPYDAANRRYRLGSVDDGMWVYVPDAYRWVIYNPVKRWFYTGEKWSSQVGAARRYPTRDRAVAAAARLFGVVVREVDPAKPENAVLS